ncbi:coniferyl-alcohol dehydrogenase [Micrococcoides hystricis]|uniref:Coniferyl-alcohol dehydrogenase n=1 Tax=Micrococcoides hystricis TaxID=1572761 RepID=A0ABV6PD77_9MICC
MDKTYVVTGAASGIGAQTAVQLSEAGARVICVDRNVPADASSDFVQLDLSKSDSISAGLAQIIELAGGPIHGLANIAGVPGTAPAELVMTVNVYGLRAFTDGLMGRLVPGAAIVNLASSVAEGWIERAPMIRRALEVSDVQQLSTDPELVRLVDEESYLFSKQCVRMLTEWQAVAGIERKIRANSVSPGPVSTPILDDFKADHGRDKVEGASKLLGKFGEVDEIADVIVFLLSDKARWINGTDIRVDGGLVAARRSGN